jgi:hypothetical protein
VAQVTQEKSAKLSPPEERVVSLAREIFVARMAGPLAMMRPDVGWHLKESYAAAESFFQDFDTRPSK